ncbi:MAG: hypothetical protein V7K38_08365 [Nostoc sp.]|uniref:hypothetical protein n=1 Tax=Nostoc sp. TaxID=1180 RepID=UPI002FF70219
MLGVSRNAPPPKLLVRYGLRLTHPTYTALIFIDNHLDKTVANILASSPVRSLVHCIEVLASHSDRTQHEKD